MNFHLHPHQTHSPLLRLLILLMSATAMMLIPIASSLPTPDLTAAHHKDVVAAGAFSVRSEALVGAVAGEAAAETEEVEAAEAGSAVTGAVAGRDVAEVAEAQVDANWPPASGTPGGVDGFDFGMNPIRHPASQLKAKRAAGR